VVSRSPNGAAFSGATAVLLQLREIMAQKKFLVTGATGDTGGYTVEQLVERGHAVRALAHREDDRSKRLEKMGAEVVIGDFLKFNDVRAAVERQLNAPIS
jgi:nucleoside-diphosphate-sugar epimerase